MNAPIHVFAIEETKYDFYVNANDPKDRREYAREDVGTIPGARIIHNKSAWVERVQEVANAAGIEVHVVRPKTVKGGLISLRRTLEGLKDAMPERPRIITLVGHALPGMFGMGSGQNVDPEATLDARPSSIGLLRNLQPLLDRSRRDEMQLFGCAVGLAEQGQTLLFLASRATGVPVSGALGSVWWGDVTPELLKYGPNGASMRTIAPGPSLKIRRDPFYIPNLPPIGKEDARLVGARVLAVRTRSSGRSLSAWWHELLWRSRRIFPTFLRWRARRHDALIPLNARDASGQMLMAEAEVMLDLGGAVEVWSVVFDRSALLSPARNGRRTLYTIDRRALSLALEAALHFDG